MERQEIHPDARRGRGAVSNDTGRFESERRVDFDDGWGDEVFRPRLATTLIRDTSRNIIATNKSPDIEFDQSINPYRGCEHGCAYCFARPSHAYLGYSPGLDFESKILYKPDAAELLRRSFDRKAYKPMVIALGVNTDAYQPAEKQLGISRSILQVMRDYSHPVCIVTKSYLVTRDIDLLSDLANDGLAKVMMSVTTLDRNLSRRMEPRAATPERRLDAIHQLTRAGIPVGVLAAPMIPGLNDQELDNILASACEAGASEASYILLRLPLELKQLWRQWLRENYPDRERRVMEHVRTAHGGKDYDTRFHHRMRGSGPYAQLLMQRFQHAKKRLGLGKRSYRLDATKFARPASKIASQQLSLL